MISRLPGRIPWPLLAVLGVQAALGLRLLWTNTAFGDEALYLWAGHLEIAHLLHGTPVPDFQTWFSGTPTFYPVLGAMADSIDGLTSARLLSLAFMLGATLCLYGFVGRLIDRRTALFACAVFAVFGLGNDLSVFATYDAMAVFLLALASYLASREPRHAELGLLAVAATLVLADAAKYAAALWNPAVIAMVGITSLPRGWRTAWARMGRTTIYTVVIGTGALAGLGGSSYWQGIAHTTLQRHVSAPVGAMAVIWESLDMLAPLLAMGLLGLLATWTDTTQRRWLCAVALLAGVLAPLDQAHLGTQQSLHKHVVFGAWFLTIAVGYVLGRVSRVGSTHAWTVSLGGLALAPVFALGYTLSKDYYSYWPPSAQYIPAIDRLMADPALPHRYSFDGQGYDVVAYYLPTRVDPADFNYQYWNTHWFTGVVARCQVSVVLLDWTGVDGKQDSANQAVLEKSANYHLAYTQQWYDEGYAHPLQVWALNDERPTTCS